MKSAYKSNPICLINAVFLARAVSLIIYGDFGHFPLPMAVLNTQPVRRHRNLHTVQQINYKSRTLYMVAQQMHNIIRSVSYRAVVKARQKIQIVCSSSQRIAQPLLAYDLLDLDTEQVTQLDLGNIVADEFVVVQ